MEKSIPGQTFRRSRQWQSLLAGLALSSIVTSVSATPADAVVQVVGAPPTPIDAPIEGLRDVTSPNVAVEMRTVDAFDKDGNMTSRTEWAYTILREAGRQEMSRLSQAYSEDETFVIESARVIDPMGKISMVDDAMIDVETAPSPDAGYVREKKTSIVFPSLAVGSRIEVKTRATVPARNPGHFHLVGIPPIHHMRLDAYEETVTAPRSMHWKVANMQGFTITPSADARQLRIRLDTPRFLSVVSSGGTERIHDEPRFEIADTDQMALQFKRIAADFEEVIEGPLPPKAATLASSLRRLPEQERIAQVMRYIQENYRYFGDWRLTHRGVRPFPLSTIENNGYGDCKDLSVLLTAMLRNAGLTQANVALIHRGFDTPNALIDGRSNVDHAIVRVMVNGQAQWLDPTNAIYQEKRTPDDLQERYAYILQANGGVTKEWSPVSRPSLTEVDTVAYIQSDGSARFESTLTFAGGASLLALAQGEHANGVEAVNHALCTSNIGAEQSRCTIERAPLGSVVPAKYSMKAHYSKADAMLKVDETLVYRDSPLAEELGTLEQRRRTTRQVDVYVSDLNRTTSKMTFPGVRTDAQGVRCRADSPWLSITTDVIVNQDHVVLAYSSQNKTRWISAKDLGSQAFGDFLQQANRCAATMRVPMRLPASMPASMPTSAPAP